MRDATTLLALHDSLSPDEQAALDAILAENPDLEADARLWRRVQAEVRADLSRDLPERDLLVLHALGRDALSADERQRLDASGVAEAVAAHPGLQAAARRIQDDRDAFEAAWDAAAAPEAALVPEDSGETRRRAPQRRAEPREAVASGASRPASRRAGRWVWRGAALMAVVAFGAVLTFLYARDADFRRITAGEQQLVALADGSEITLAPGAVLMIPREGAEISPRQARLLAGTALFDITRDPSAPFEVQTPNADIAVLGTTFSVAVEPLAQSSATAVVLASGSVRVAPRAQAEKAVTLAPGETTRILALDAPAPPSLTDVASDLEWTGTIYARELSAAEVVRRIAQATGADISVDADLAGEPVSGTFHTSEGALSTLNTLALALDADVLRTAEGFRLAR
ncbi:FecR family protein [Rubricoccus marinus]|uniref:FecR protein domain-containing protein n=1 Tax=Rubricoccus marinus TaxID=716817 RepID=A0A259TW29_9BACT|nr:FecR domain-containing protein [Rubricoccus marinus]OZC01758.1 hypothetical protein BSZ36_01400 [Rubricoccus marinus]